MLVQWQAGHQRLQLEVSSAQCPHSFNPSRRTCIFRCRRPAPAPDAPQPSFPPHRFRVLGEGGLHPGGVVVPALRRDYPVPSTNSGMSIKGQFAFRQRQVGLSAQGRYSGQCGVSRRPDGARGRSAQRAWSAHGPLAGRCGVAHPAVCWPLPDPSFKTVADPI